MMWRIAGQHCPAQPSTAQHSTAQHSTAQQDLNVPKKQDSSMKSG